MGRAGQWTIIYTLALALQWTGQSAQAGVSLQRLASINLCTDQYLLSFASRSQIAAVSAQAHDRAVSFLAVKARGIPRIHGSAEELLNIKAQLVLMGPYDKRLARSMLSRRNIPMLTVGTWHTLTAGRGKIRAIGQRLQRTGRAERLIKNIDASLKTLAQAMPDRRRNQTFIVLQRRGYVLGTGIVRELLQIAGLKDMSRQFRAGGSGIVTLEQIVQHRPDFIALEEASGKPEDQGEAKLAHPVLKQLYPASRRLVIPVKLAICSGPATPALIHHVAAEIARKVK